MKWNSVSVWWSVCLFMVDETDIPLPWIRRHGVCNKGVPWNSSTKLFNTHIGYFVVFGCFFSTLALFERIIIMKTFIQSTCHHILTTISNEEIFSNSEANASEFKKILETCFFGTIWVVICLKYSHLQPGE